MKNQLLHRRLSLSFLSLPMLVACSEPLTAPTQVESLSPI
jgi:hypothetical protein